MKGNLYLRTYRKRLAHRHASEGVASRLARVGIGSLAALALVPLVEPVFLGFLDLPPEAWPEGIEAVVFRACVLVVGLLSLDVYSALTNDRPFRKAKTPLEAIDHLRQRARRGMHNPELVDKFIGFIEASCEKYNEVPNPIGASADQQPTATSAIE